MAAKPLLMNGLNRFQTTSLSHEPKVPCVFCPPSLYIDFSRDLIDDLSSEIKLGSQLINAEDDKALTGGINSLMLSDFSTDYVLDRSL